MLIVHGIKTDIEEYGYLVIEGHDKSIHLQGSRPYNTEAVAKAKTPLLERIAAVEAELNSEKKNSSKPLSSDMVKPPQPVAKAANITAKSK